MRIAIALFLALSCSSHALTIEISSGGPNDWHLGFEHYTLSQSPGPLPPALQIVQLYPGITASVTLHTEPSIPGDPLSPLVYNLAWSGPSQWAFGYFGIQSFQIVDGVDLGAGNGFAHGSVGGDWYPGGDGWLYYYCLRHPVSNCT